MITITKEKFITLINNIDNGTFINLKTKTTPNNISKLCPHKNITKITSANYLIANSYQTRVNNNYKKENINENFIAQQNKIGNHISKTILYNNNLNKFYIQVEYFNNHITTYIDEHNNNITELIKPFLFNLNNYTNQKSNKKAKYINFNIDNIIQATINKQTYLLI